MDLTCRVAEQPNECRTIVDVECAALDAAPVGFQRDGGQATGAGLRGQVRGIGAEDVIDRV